MTDVDAQPGLDRRALIKKGLVGAGIAATVPVITTFNTAAFASSVPGCHLVNFSIANNGNLTGPTNGNTGTCNPTSTRCVGTPQIGVINPFILGSTSGSGSSTVYTFALQAGWTSCDIVAATADGAPCFTGFANLTGTSSSISVVRNQLSLPTTIRILVVC